MAEVLVFAADGLEEVECLGVVDLLRRAGIDTRIVSVNGSQWVTGAHNISIRADEGFDPMECRRAKLLFLPGGMPGTRHLAEHEGLKEELEAAFRENRRIAAICAAPSILGDMGILNEKRAVCFPGFESHLKSAQLVTDKVITDGTVTTSKALGCALDLGLELIKLLRNEELAEQIKKEIYYV